MFESLKLIEEYTKKYPGPWIVTQRDTPVNAAENMTLGLCNMVAHEWGLNDNKDCIHFVCRGEKIFLGEMIFLLGFLQNGFTMRNHQNKEILVFKNTIWTQNVNKKNFHPEMAVVIEHL